MDILFEPTAEDGPAAPAPFRFLAAGTFTGGKSFWLTADGSDVKPPGGAPGQRLASSGQSRGTGGDCDETRARSAENPPH